MARIEIRGLGRSFRRRSGEALAVLRDLHIHADDGELICLLGPSGCGKSTTLHVLAGLVEPDSGSIDVDGGGRWRDLVYGYVFQRPRLLNWRTARENVSFALEGRGVPRWLWRERADRYLGLVGLDAFADEYPLQLSGGMQQRVALARALAIEPDVLLMDEPFSGLDELTARTMRAELLRIWEHERRTVFFVTHNALEAAYLADRVYVLSPRPATVIDEVSVALPRPRDVDDPAVHDLSRAILRRVLLPVQ